MSNDGGKTVSEGVAGAHQQQQSQMQRQEEQRQQVGQHLPTHRERLRTEIDQMPLGKQRDTAEQAFAQSDGHEF